MDLIAVHQRRYHGRRGVIMFLVPVSISLVLIATISAAAENASPKSPEPSVWRTVNRCPVNAMYMIMKLNGVDVDYAKLGDVLQVGEKGSNLTALQNCGRSFGLDAKVLKVTPEELPHHPLPAIAHLESEGPGTGHYVVVLAAGDQGVEYLDGTTAITATVAKSVFDRQWSGYLVTFEKREWWQRLWPVSLALTVGLLLMLSITSVWRKLRPRGTQQSTLSPNETARDERLPSPLLPAASSSGLMVGLFTLLFGMGAGGSQALAEEPPLPTLEQIRSAIEEGWKGVESLQVEYQHKAEPLVSQNTVQKVMKILFFQNEEKTFAFKDNKRYLRIVRPASVEALVPVTGTFRSTSSPSTEKSSPKTIQFDPEIIAAFDGSKLRRIYPKSEREALILNLASIRAGHLNDDQRWFNQDYLFNVGHILPDAIDPSRDRKDQRIPDLLASGNFRVTATDKVEGVPCITVSWPKRETIYLDPKLGYALRRREYFDADSGLLTNLLTNKDFVEVRPGLWLPKTCWADRCAPSSAAPGHRGEPMIRHMALVHSLTINKVPDSLFELEIEPGSVVVDGTSKPADGKTNPLIDYVMPADKSHADRAVADALRRGSGLKTTSPVAKWIVAGNVILVVLLCVFAARRLRNANK